MYRRRPEIIPTVIALKKKSSPHKLIARELQRLGYFNARGGVVSTESIKKILRDARPVVVDAEGPLAPG